MRRRRLLALTASFLLSETAMSTEAAPEPLPEIHTLWDYNDPAKSEAAFQVLLPRARAAGDRSYELQLLTQIARTHSLRRRFEESHRILDDVEKQLTPEQKLARLRYLLERGRAFNSAGRPKEAVPLFKQAWELGREIRNDDLAVDAAHMLGIAETGDRAVEWSLEAMKLAETSREPRAKGWLGPLYNNLGWTYFERKEYTRALDLLQKSLEFYEERKRVPQVRIARWSVAKVLRVLGRVDEALRRQQALERELDAAGEPDGYVFEELGECLLALDRKPEAAPYFKKAHALLSQDEYLKQSEPDRLTRLKTLAGP